MRAIAIGIFVTASLAAEDWRMKPYEEWSEKTAVELLTRSPWAKQLRAPLTWVKREPGMVSVKEIPGVDRNPDKPLGPLGGIGVPREKLPRDADLIVRWSSALPLREAVAVYRMRSEKLDREKAAEIVNSAGDWHVLEIFGAPVEMAHMGVESIEALAVLGVSLRTRTGRMLKPARAAVTLQRTTLAVKVYFPRSGIVADDGDLECSGDFQIMKFKVKFRLEDMEYRGKLEI